MIDDRTKRRIEEMDKIRRDGTSTEFDKGYRQALNDLKKKEVLPKEVILLLIAMGVLIIVGFIIGLF